MNGRPMNALEYYAQLAQQQQQQQQVPPGNPMTDYFDKRQMDAGTMGAAAGTVGVPLMGLSMGETLEGNPLGLLGVLMSAGLLQGGARNASDAMRAGRGSDMWFNRFGNGDPNQGLPGTPSGPAYRRR
jgi:hypothetical protein